jgi:hypothetical protein
MRPPRWVVDGDGWYRRFVPAGSRLATKALANRCPNHSFVAGSYLYCRNQKQADRLDSGLPAERKEV